MSLKLIGGLFGLALAGLAVLGGKKASPGYTIKGCKLEIQDKGRALEHALTIGQTHSEAQFQELLLGGCSLAGLSPSFREQASFLYELLRRALTGRVSVGGLTLEQANQQLAAIRIAFGLQQVDTAEWPQAVSIIPKAPPLPARGYSIGPNCGALVIHDEQAALAHARQLGKALPIATWKEKMWDGCLAESWLQAPRFFYLMMHAAMSSGVAAGVINKTEASLWLTELRGEAKDRGIPDFLDWPVELT